MTRVPYLLLLVSLALLAYGFHTRPTIQAAGGNGSAVVTIPAAGPTVVMITPRQ